MRIILTITWPFPRIVYMLDEQDMTTPNRCASLAGHVDSHGNAQVLYQAYIR